MGKYKLYLLILTFLSLSILPYNKTKAFELFENNIKKQSLLKCTDLKNSLFINKKPILPNFYEYVSQKNQNVFTNSAIGYDNTETEDSHNDRTGRSDNSNDNIKDKEQKSRKVDIKVTKVQSYLSKPLQKNMYPIFYFKISHYNLEKKL